MVRPPTFDSNGIKRGAWSKKEDDILRAFILESGHHNWRRLPRLAGLPRCGKSCRLRWVNYLQPGLKRGKITKDEEDIIIKLHDKLGPKWSAIAAALPGRTDNAIKNYWHTHIKKRNGRGNREIISSSSFPSETSSPLHVPIPSSSSSETSSSVTTDIKELKQLFAQDQDDDLIGLGYDHTCLSQFDVDFGMFLEMKYEHKSTISSSLDSTIAYFWSEPFEEDIVDMVLW